MEPWETNQQMQRLESKRFIEVLHSSVNSKNEQRVQKTQ